MGRDKSSAEAAACTHALARSLLSGAASVVSSHDLQDGKSLEMQLWTTDSFSRSQRFSRWAEEVCQTYTAITPHATDRQDFHAHVRSSTVQGTSVVWTRSCAQRFSRSEREIGDHYVDAFFANFHLAGTCTVAQGRRTATVGRGQFSIVDATIPYTSTFTDDWEVVSIRIDRTMLRSRFRGVSDSAVTTIGGLDGIGSPAFSMARCLAQTAEQGAVHAQEVLLSSFADMLALALRSVGPSPSLDDEFGADPMRQKRAIDAYIRAHLQDPELDASRICQDLGISQRSLYRAFEESGEQPSKTIRNLRLFACAEEIANHPVRGILSIALKWGFNNPSHFSKVFGRQFGCSPSAYRADSQAVKRDSRRGTAPYQPG